MRFAVTRVFLCFVGALGVGDVAANEAQSSRGRLEEAQSRFQAIYERGELREKRWRADWLADSSGLSINAKV